MKNLAVYDTPAIPGGWDRRGLVRIMDPLGLSAAWIHVESAGSIVGFFVRSDPSKSWVPVLQSMNGEAGGRLIVDGASNTEHWEMESRDPTGVVVRSAEGNCRVHYACEFGGLDCTIDGDRIWGMTIHLSDGTMHSHPQTGLQIRGNSYPGGIVNVRSSPECSADRDTAGWSIRSTHGALRRFSLESVQGAEQ